MPDEKLGRPAREGATINRLEEREEERGFAGGQEKSREHVARPVRAEVNPRPGDGRGHQKIKPSPAPEEKGEDNGNAHIVRDMTGGKRRTRAVAIAIVGIANLHPFKEGKKFRACLGQFHHPDTLDLFRPAAIDKPLQTRGQAAIYEEGEADAENKRAPLESTED